MPLYDAFISYSHAKDKPIAAALQSAVQKLGKPWYRRGSVWLGGLVVGSIAQGILHAAGFHMWEPIWRALQNVGRQVGLL
jgi:hypothetical protein